MARLGKEREAVRAAVMFFTRIPIPQASVWDPDSLQRAAAYFPMVGWLVGGIGAAVFAGAALLWPPAIASGLSLAATLLATGAFHEDGFADVCDGFGGGTTRERVLEIMRDSRIGAFGAIGILTLLAGKWHAVAALPLAHAPGAIVAAHAVSRGASGLLMRFLPYAQQTGKSKPLATRLPGMRLIASVGFALAPLLLLPPAAWWCLVGAGLTTAWMGWRFHARIRGFTGDCLGAAQQVAEVACYLTFLLVL